MQLFPIEIIYHAPITMGDGVVLSAQIWLPENASSTPVPGILEFLPYRKRDGTAVRDAMNHPYVASRGYACVRVDMRGTGDSQGLLEGEYLKQEQDDAITILEWMAAQKWCTGSCGMIGISWGGFNSLQVAARHPPQLKAIVSICSTDDRYEDDIHWKGGCLLTENFTWAASMLSINTAPPDPAVVGDEWRKLWLQRLENGGFYADEWHRHQRRDDFWKHASICEDYSSIKAATYLVGGWADPYTNIIYRSLDNLKCPKKALVGPWGHKYPNFGVPGPQIGFLQETVRWWDKWLKGTENGIMEEPQLRAYLQDTTSPAPFIKDAPGRWVAEESWSDKKYERRRLGLAPGRLTTCNESIGPTAPSGMKLEICSPQTHGFASGRWLVFGIEGEGPSDQRLDSGGSLNFDTDKLTETLDLLGPVSLNACVASDKPNAFLAATLSEVLPSGAVTRISYGVLNLTHRHGHEHLQPLEPGKFYNVSFKLNHCGQRIGVGSRLRLSIANTFFPMVWPSPEVTTLAIDCAKSSIDLPVRPENPLDHELKDFKPAINGTLSQTNLRPAKHRNVVEHDWDTNETKLIIDWDDGLWQIDTTGWIWSLDTKTLLGIKPDDPLSARVEQSFVRECRRDNLVLITKGWTKMTMTATHMVMTAGLEAIEQGKSIFSRDWAFTVPRDHV